MSFQIWLMADNGACFYNKYIKFGVTLYCNARILSFPSPKCCWPYIKKLIIYKLFQLSMTPRHRYGVHGQYMVWINEDASQAKGGRRPSCKRDLASKRFPTLQQLSSVVLVRPEVYKVVGITDVFTVLSIADWTRQSVNQCPEQNLGICETSLYTEAAFLHKQFSKAQEFKHWTSSSLIRN